MNERNPERNQIQYRYGIEIIPVDITQKEVFYFFFLNSDERHFVKEATKWLNYRLTLGFKIGTYKLTGRFQKKIESIPESVVKFIGKQLSLPIAGYEFKYSDRKKTILNHNKLIRNFLGLKYFPTVYHENLIEYLIDNAPDPGHFPAWINLAEDYLRDNKFILPPNKTLRRIILSARKKGLNIVTDRIYNQMTNETIIQLDELLSGESDSKWNIFTNKRFLKATSNKINEVFESIENIRLLKFDYIDLKEIHKNYIKYFANRGIQMSSKQLNDQSGKSRYVLIFITLKNLLSELTDISIQMNDEIISEVFLKGETKSNDYFRKNKKTVKNILSAFHFMSDTLLSYDLSATEKINAINDEIPTDKMEELNIHSATLNIPKGTEKLYFASNSYQKIQKYLPHLIGTFKMTSVLKDDPLIKAANYYLARKNAGTGGIGKDAPVEFVNRENWKKVIFDKDGFPKTKPWIVCLADSLRESLRKGSINVEGTKQYKSLDSDLISRKEFKENPFTEDKNFPYTSTAETVVASISKSICNLSIKEEEWNKNDTASIDCENKIHFRKLDKLEKPESVIKLQNVLYKSLTRRPFCNVLSEADKMTGFSSLFTRLSSGLPIKSTETKLGSALYSLIYAAACNIPLTKMSSSTNIPINFLTNLRDEVLRPQTVQAAIAVLVDFYSRLPLAQILGSGNSSSSDGQGVIVEGNPLGAKYNRKLFKKNTKGFIIYTHILDNYAPFYTQIFPAGPREAPYVADGLLYCGISLIPREHYTDTHGYTDIVFAVLYLLGFRFCPRIANVPDLSLWYLRNHEPSKKEIFNNGISFSSIADQWETMQRVIHTIYIGETRASQIIRKLSAFGTRHSLHKAFSNFGKLCKTRHIFEMAGDMNFRRNILQGLNKGESRNALSNEIRFGSRGIFKEKDPELRLCMASATNLLILCSAISNIIEMQHKIRVLRTEGMIITEDQLKFMSPFPHNHYNFIGNFSFRSIPKVSNIEIEKQFKPIF